jgi:chemotaxis protein MotB
MGPQSASLTKTIKKMRGSRKSTVVIFLLGTTNLFACGYSQDEWDQKVRATEELRGQLAGEKSARAKAEADYADALDEIEVLRTKLSEGGMNLDTLHASLESKQKALAEYEDRMARLDKIRAKFEKLRAKLEELVRLGLKVDVRDNRMVIQLPGDVLFDSGSDKLKEEGEVIVLEVAGAIRGDADLNAREFQVAGHTDNRALLGGYFRDNWGLSAMRARSVLGLLTTPVEEEGGGLPPRNWSAAGYGSTDPVGENVTEEGRRRNRRVELVIQPDVAEMLDLNSIASESEATKE